MAEVKWVKLYIDIFESNDKIKKIRRLPCGNEIVLLWIILLCKAGKCNDGGRIYVTPSEPYAPEDIADDYKFEINTVKLGLEALCRFNMIEISDEGIIYVLNWEEYQNVEGMEKIREQTRQRVAACRERKRLAECNVTCNATVTHGNAIDKDKEIRNKNKDKEITTTTTNNYHSFLQSDEFALFQRVSEAFGACEVKCSADVIDDFIAYNEARGWVGIGGESVLDNLERYAARWARGEDARGRSKWT